MKKALLLFAVVCLLSSCMTPRPASKIISTIDFTPYNEQGFFLTQFQTVPYEYIPVGIVGVTMQSGSGSSKFDIVRYSAKDALDTLCEELKRLGADGIVDLKITYTPVTVGRDKLGDFITAVDCSVSGMAIKKK